ncbi:MAG: phage tail tape measure protein [Clostridiales bacterium]|nr:phage tail tape measure protein [Clostridiales bacterium]
MISGETDQSLNASIRKARKELDSLERKAGLSSKAISDSFGGMSAEGIDKLSSMSDKAFGAIVKGSKLAAAGIAGIAAASTYVGMGFEEQMSTVRAIAQASDADMKRLTALAKEMGETTKFSAEEAGKGLEYMAMAGWKTEDMISGLPGIMNLAAASGEDLGSVSDIVTDAMTAFGMAADESGRFADVLAQASSNSNTNVGMMGETFKYVAPVAGAFGYTVEDVAVATGLMANAGIKAEKAGTAMRTMLTNLAKPTKQMRGYMKALSISLVDGHGEMKPFNQQLEEMRAGFASLTEAEKAEYAAGIAGKEGMSGLLAIVNASEEDFQKLTESIGNSAGAAERMAQVRLDNLKGDLTLLLSATQGAGIELYEGFSGDMRSGVQYAIAWVTSFSDSLEENIPTARRLVKQFGKELGEFFGPILDIGKWLAKNPQVIKGGLMGISSALLTFKAVKVAKDGMKMLATISSMASAWPVAAVGVMIGTIVGIGAAIQETERQAAKQSLADHFGDITLSMQELEDAARYSLGEGLFRSIDEFAEAGTKTSKFYDSMQSGIREINKAGWKLSLGIEFDETDTSSYVSAVDQYVKDAQNYITSRGYELKLAVDIVIGEDSGGLDGSDAFYQSLYGQLDPLQRGLQEVLQDITDNGLTLDKDKIVRQYLADISEITSMISDAQNAAQLQMIQGKFSGASLTPETFQNYQDTLNEYTDKAIENIDDSYEQILTSLNAQRIAGEKGMDGGISQEEFDSQSKIATQAYYARKAQVVKDGYQSMRDTIMETYGDDIGPALEAMSQSIDQNLKEFAEKGYSSPQDWSYTMEKAVMEAMGANDISAGGKKALKMLLEGMEPNQEQMMALTEQYKKAGGDMADAQMRGISEAMDEMSSLRAVSGKEDSIWALLGRIASDDPAMATAMIASRNVGATYADSCINEIITKCPEAEQEARNFLDAVKAEFEKGVDPVTVRIPITLDMVESYRKTGNVFGPKELPQHGDGGIFGTRHIAEVAEDGPESIIPINQSSHALQLWKETGRLLGAYQENNYEKMYGGIVTNGGMAADDHTGSFSPTFSPTIYVDGGANVKEDVMSGLEAGFERFKEMMERYRHEEFRVEY